MKSTQTGRLVIVAVIALLIMLIPFVLGLADRHPTIPRQEKKSMTALSESIPFPLYYPSKTQLNTEHNAINYFITTVPHPSRASYAQPIVTGYSIMQYSIGEDSLFGKVEYRGTNIEKEAGQWALFDDVNYTCVAENVPYSLDGINFFYSEYRHYPATMQEIEAQRQGGAKIPLNPADHEFTIFMAYIDCDDIRYSVIFSELEFNEYLEKSCVEEASHYFINLLQEENFQ